MKRAMLFLFVLFGWISSNNGVLAADRRRSWQRHMTEHQFETTVQEMLSKLDGILNETKSIQLASKQDHTYEDKYSLVEFITLNTWESLFDIFSIVGLSESTFLEEEASKSLLLSFEAMTDCSMISEQEVDIKGDGVIIETTNNADTTTTTRRNVHRVTQYTWNIQESYELFVCMGGSICDNTSKNRKTLQQRSMEVSVKTTSKDAPTQCPRILSTKTIDLGWLARRMTPEGDLTFKIDRNAETCRTPARNEDIESTLDFHDRLHDWFMAVGNHMESLYIPPAYNGATLQNPILKDASAHVPWASQPVFENSTVLTAERVQILREHEREGLANLLSKATQIFPTPSKDVIVSVNEAFLHLFTILGKQYLASHVANVNFVENMLYKQLQDAIGQYINGEDFEQYMKFYNKKLFAAQFEPNPFSIAVRHRNSTPVGTVSIESLHQSKMQPVSMMTRVMPEDSNPIEIPIDASTTVKITGEQFLHGYIQYVFGRASGNHPELIARARQYSSFVLLIGTMTGPHTFSPTSGILLKNKDEIIIPLLMETLPSAKAFKDAISSLSPEQQAFAKAFRSMRLESSVFGICIIQLKPQMERLLNLPEDALAKEIELTESLTKLFVDYQIPSDLLSFDGDDTLDTSKKVSVVKSYVRSLEEIIEKSKQEVIKEEEKVRQAAGIHTARMDYATAGSSDFGHPTAAPTSSPTATSSTSRSDLRRVQKARAQPLTMTMMADEAMSEDTISEEESLQESTNDNDLKRDYLKVDKVGDGIDFTQIPVSLDAKLEEYDTDGFLRPLIVKTDLIWTLKRRAHLLAEAKYQTLHKQSIQEEKQKTFDLLDAISKSGNLPVEASELHVVIGLSHHFEKNIMETLYKDNINPITKAEKSMLLFGSEIFGTSAREVVESERDVQRLEEDFPTFLQEATRS